MQFTLVWRGHLCLSLYYVYVSIFIFVHMSICPYIYIDMCVSLSVCLSICLSIYLSICLYISVYLSICRLSVCLLNSQSIHPWINSSLCLSIHLSVFCLSDYLSISLIPSHPCFHSITYTVFLCLCLSFCFSMYLSIINTNNNRTKSIDLGKFMILDSDQRFKKWQFFR